MAKANCPVGFVHFPARLMFALIDAKASSGPRGVITGEMILQMYGPRLRQQCCLRNIDVKLSPLGFRRALKSLIRDGIVMLVGEPIYRFSDVFMLRVDAVVL